jgi:cytochrome c oxidase assembly protein subunit 15
MVHRIVALVLFAGLCVLAWRLWAGADAAMRRTAVWLLGLALWQMISGLSNVVLGWPLVAALAHSAGAAGLVAVTTSLIARARAGERHRTAPSRMEVSVDRTRRLAS